MHILGIVFALAALASWTFGDFFIQKSVRLVGDIKTLVYIGVIGAIGIYPFIAKEITPLLAKPTLILLLTLTGTVIFFAAIFDFEALKRGKLAIIEPVLGMELPVTIALSVVLWKEQLSLIQYLLMATAFIGILLAISIHHTHLHYHKRIFEKGVLLAALGSTVMGLVNFLVGISSQETSPLMAIWFTNIIFTLCCFIYMATKGEFRGIIRDFTKNLKITLATSVFDNAAWIFFAFAASLIPISIATTISEGYIAFVVILGLVINKEKIRWHQIVGVIIAILSIITLSAIT
ncbi:MAG: EamA family transporter [Patescibacteria group bacterium]